jgi:pyridoxal phosphate enzyme (YggS family)
MGIKENLVQIKSEIPAHVKLVAVSKTMPVKYLLEAYEAGQHIFGENKAQEIINKQPLLPADIEWHFIGHLQTNKVKYLAPFIGMIETVDSLKLLIEIDRQAAKLGRTINCLLEFHIAEEATKFGLDIADASEIIESQEFRDLKNINICGVMGMATFTGDIEQIHREFSHLRQIFTHLKKEYFSNNIHFKEISMGMSGDYKLAIEEGSTMVRIGSAIFGDRNY